MKSDFEKHCREKGTWEQWLSTSIMGKYLVTTCYRQSSAPEGGWFYETFIWEFTKEDRELIGDATGYGRSHFQICQWIIDNNGWDSNKFDEAKEAGE
jgi:hypothetical protein